MPEGSPLNKHSLYIPKNSGKPLDYHQSQKRRGSTTYTKGSRSLYALNNHVAFCLRRSNSLAAKEREFYNYDLGLCELAFAMEVDDAQHCSILFYRTCDPVAYLHTLDVFQGPAICSDGIQVTEIIDADFHTAKCGLRRPLRRPPI